MTAEQNDCLIDLLFKQINLRGELPKVAQGEGVDMGWMRPEPVVKRGKSPSEHPDPFGRHDKSYL